MNKSIKEILKDNLIWICLLSFALLLVGEIMSQTIHFNFKLFNSDFKYTFDLYFGFWGIWAVILAFLFISKKNKYILDNIKKNNDGNNFKFLVVGFVIGFITNMICALIAYLNNDFQLSFSKFELMPLLILFIAVFIQSSAEEVLCRGFLYTRILKRYNSAALAIVINSIFFAALHMGNEGISLIGMLDLFFSGIFFSLMVYCFNSLWMAMAAHTTWNFTQNIILGLPNSGALSRYSIMTINQELSKSSFAFDKVFGLEGTLISLLIMTISCVIIFMYAKKTGRITI